MTYWLHGRKGFEKSLPAFDRYNEIKLAKYIY